MKTTITRTPPNTVSYAEWLELPEGFQATRFHDGIYIHRAGESFSGQYPMQRGFIPNPYDPQSKAWWIEQAKTAVANINKP